MARRRRRSRIGQFYHNLSYRFGEYAQRGTVAALPYIPRWLMEVFTSVMAGVTYVLLRRYRTRMIENVDLVLSADLSDPAERRALVRRAWLSFGRALLDTMVVLNYSPSRIASMVGFEGEEHVKQALAKGKGVLALSAHLGSFPLIGARLAASGYPFSVVVKQPADESFARVMDDYRARLNVHTISAKPRREAVRNILKALRGNRIVLIIADEFKSGDVMVDFFGLRVPAPRGPAALALRTGAVTLPMFATRRRRGEIVLSVSPPLAPIVRDDIEESVVATTAHYTRCLESAIREYPDQWNWLGLPRHRSKVSRVDEAPRQLGEADIRVLDSGPGEKRTGMSRD
jgi:KDO2-lipid IV(A) lauroyltransferase